MFEKRSHVNTSVSWGGRGAVWAQTPGKPRRQIPVLHCLASWQNRQDHIKIADHCRSSSSLLYSPHCWYFLGTKEVIKFLLSPYPSMQSLGRDQNLLISDIIRPKELFSDIPVQGSGTSAPTQNLCPSSRTPSLVGMLTPFQWQPIVFSSFSHTGQNMGNLQEHTLYLEHCRTLEHPTPIFLIMQITTHLAPLTELPWNSSSLACSYNANLVFPDFFWEGSEENDPMKNHHRFVILGYRKDLLVQP